MARITTIAHKQTLEAQSAIGPVASSNGRWHNQPDAAAESEEKMSFSFAKLTLEQYRCFEHLELDLEPDATVLVAENGGGKSAAIEALRTALEIFLKTGPRDSRSIPANNARMVVLGDHGHREAAGQCKMAWRINVKGMEPVDWTLEGNAESKVSRLIDRNRDAIRKQIHSPGTRWPVFGYYGVDRMRRGIASTEPSNEGRSRLEGYVGCLNFAQDDSGLLTWLLEEFLQDATQREQDDPRQSFGKAVMGIFSQIIPGVDHVWYDPRGRAPFVQFKNGQAANWKELSAGYHAFLSLVADIARRAMTINPQDGVDAPKLASGVVLIDEIDLHLHPRWQRVVLGGLREAFPNIQFVVTTHSPQVLSSAENRQVRLFQDGKLWPGPVRVEGRDSNSIIREYFDTNDRDREGQTMLDELDKAIDQGKKSQACEQFAVLRDLWGENDRNIILRKGRIERIRDA